MQPSYSIRYVKQHEIDKVKWDSCVDIATNGLVYAHSFYLDALTDHWDGLVFGDYEAVMPLPWRKKFGIAYLYQPFLVAQGGVFGKTISPALVEAFVDAIPAKFKYIDICLNNNRPAGISNNEIARTNFILNLRNSYEELCRAYNENTRRNIKRATEAGLKCEKNISVEDVIKLAQAQMAVQNNLQEDFTGFRKVYLHLATQTRAITYGIFSSKKELLSSAVFFFSDKRAYYILVGNHPGGKPLGASHALIDTFIRDHSGKETVLDFEGSDIPGLANFYAGFGAVVESYTAIKLNRLPFFLKWVKS